MLEFDFNVKLVHRMKPIYAYPDRLTHSPILLGLVVLIALGLIISHGAVEGFFSALGVMLQLIFGGILTLVAIHKKWLIVLDRKPTENETKESTNES